VNGQTDFTVKAEPEDFKNTLFLAMELSRATWLVATFAPRLGEKIGVHAIPGGEDAGLALSAVRETSPIHLGAELPRVCRILVRAIGARPDIS
jgi:hypothetical protein